MRRLSGFLAIAMVASLLAIAAPASAAETIWVHPGDSIQAAVDAAHPGDTIVVTKGTYYEEVQIQKNHLTIHGEGAVIAPPSQPAQTMCAQAFGEAGFCVVAKELDQYGNVVTPVVDDHISGFTIRDFSAFGILTYGSRRTVIRHNKAFNNTEYGFVSFNSSHNRFIDNEAAGADEAGFYYGDSPNADAYIHGNSSHDNLLGIFIRNASEGTIAGNRTYENCVGTLFLAGAPGPVNDWTYKHNKVWDNDKVCPAGEESPPLSGVGVVLSGSNNVHVVDNWIVANHPKGPSAVSGGVVVITSIAAPIAPTNNVVMNNTIRRNSPYDVVYDGTGSNNQFTDNWCGTSTPAGICH